MLTVIPVAAKADPAEKPDRDRAAIPHHPPASVHTNNHWVDKDYTKCIKWRKRALDRIKREDPDMVILRSFTKYHVIRGGQRLSGEANKRALRQGYASALKRLQGTDGRCRGWMAGQLPAKIGP